MQKVAASLLATLVLAGIGCGSGDTLFGTPAGLGSGGSGMGGAGGSDDVGAGGDITGAGGFGTSTHASSSHATVTASSSSSASSSASSSSSSSASSSSSGGGPPLVSLPCAGSTCSGAKEDVACCWDNYNVHRGPQAMCVEGAPNEDGCQTASEQGAKTRIECEDEGDCLSGQVCCARRVWGWIGQQYVTWYDQVTCASSCGGDNVPLCIPGVTKCAPGYVCKQSQLLPPGYTVCSNT